MEKENNRVNKAIEIIFENIDKISKTKSIIGEPIYNDGDIIIPISTVNCYSLIAGGEYGKMNILTKNKNFPFSIGNGTIINLKPTSFLIKNKTGEYNIINTSSSSYEKIADNVINYLKCMIKEQE